MRRSEFLAQLRTVVTHAADAALASTGRTTAQCPYLEYWFSYYSRQDSQHQDELGTAQRSANSGHKVLHPHHSISLSLKLSGNLYIIQRFPLSAPGCIRERPAGQTPCLMDNNLRPMVVYPWRITQDLPSLVYIDAAMQNFAFGPEFS